jgi:hypothetical protein
VIVNNQLNRVNLTKCYIKYNNVTFPRHLILVYRHSMFVKDRHATLQISHCKNHCYKFIEFCLYTGVITHLMKLGKVKHISSIDCTFTIIQYVSEQIFYSSCYLKKSLKPTHY